MQITEFSGKLNTEQKVTFMLNTLDNIQILIKNMIDSHPRLISFKNYYRKPISKKKRNLNNNFYQNLSEKIQLLIQELTSLYDAIIKSANDISGSIIQNSAACLAVFEFSALNVGPNV